MIIIPIFYPPLTDADEGVIHVGSPTTFVKFKRVSRFLRGVH
jgi:hypothetical protein